MRLCRPAVRLLALSAVPVAFPRSAGAQEQAVTAFVGATVLPMHPPAALLDQTVLVRGDRVVALGRLDQVTVPPGARRVAAAGQDRLAPGRLPEFHKLGKGPVTLLLLPCMSCRWRAYDRFMERNQERYTMYAVTLPGFGGTPAPDLPRNGDQPVWQDNAVHALIRLLEEEGLDSVVVVGQSFGAITGLQLIALRPERIRAFVMLDGSVTSDRSWFHDDVARRRASAASIVAEWGPRLADPDRWQGFNIPGIADGERRLRYHGWFMATPRDVVLQYWRENALKDNNPALRSLPVPTLDLHAITARDSTPEESRGQYLDDMTRNGAPALITTVFLYQTGHFVHEDRPEVVDDLIWRFLRGHPVTDYRPAAGR